MPLFTPYHTKEARAVSTALALMLEQSVATWAEVEVTPDNAEAVEQINASYSDLTPFLRMPTKVAGSRSLSPAVTIAVCDECHGWQTVPMTRGRSISSGVSISATIADKLTCIKTTDCSGKQEVALPAVRESQIDK
jgi:hypothetical protein